MSLCSSKIILNYRFVTLQRQRAVIYGAYVCIFRSAAAAARKSRVSGRHNISRPHNELIAAGPWNIVAGGAHLQPGARTEWRVALTICPNKLSDLCSCAGWEFEKSICLRDPVPPDPPSRSRRITALRAPMIDTRTRRVFSETPSAFAKILHFYRRYLGQIYLQRRTRARALLSTPETGYRNFRSRRF